MRFNTKRSSLSLSDTIQKKAHKNFQKKVFDRYSGSWVVCDECNGNLLNPQNSYISIHILFALAYAGNEARQAVQNPPQKAISMVVDEAKDTVDIDTGVIDDIECAKTMMETCSKADMDVIDTSALMEEVGEGLIEEYSTAGEVDADANDIDSHSGKIVLCNNCIQEFGLD